MIDTTNSPHVKLKSIGIGDCRWTDGFWAEKFKQCEEVMVPHMGTLLKGDIGHGYNNFKIAAGLKKGKHQGFAWHDGDFFKWMEAAVYIYAVNQDAKIIDELDEIIEVIAKAQEDDGYLHTNIQIDGTAHFSNRKYHEMYNCGHLYTTACVHHRVTGKTNFLDTAIKNANLLYKLFQPQPKELSRFGFNQSQIMGLTELYRTTKDKRYLELAEIFINNRGKSPVVEDSSTEGYPIGDMVQERVPLREETEAVGHAVLALYYYAGAADVYAETGEQALIDALDRLWDNVANKKMYVTGAVGQAHFGASTRRDKIEEGFLDAYLMPNATAYNETCANIANAMFNFRMLGIKGDSRHADIMELVAYNSALVGISADGKHYFYANPLRYNHGQREYQDNRDCTESANREPYIECFCCPPNLVRTIAKISNWAYSLTSNGVAVNLFGGNRLATKLTDGSEIKLHQDSGYPWEGNVKITIDACKQEPFEILIRIPGWADQCTLLVNGDASGEEISPGTFARIHRAWKPGDTIDLKLPMDVKLMKGHPFIEETRNQTAIKVGPLVYCLESPDLPEGTRTLDVYVPSDIELEKQNDPDVLGGITTLTGNVHVKSDERTSMYEPIGKPEWKNTSVRFVPYYAWSNRGNAEMTVWLPVVWK
ncbi:glycoside hydrolase family 127 protein [Aporhodopirellula aestuarii]|uniref:Glycoside hydrolase family 127 protein n=1 Tax=Aporhodopirellula aestuarii TaxID=2950107 RepID=A0ABT0U2P3_9BACT|nr:beta-L-arabinofuranosidase domain-containing protein [Aporhodopirellula aestuarii]MCM2371164.1 glycoside hydrolase family 127 protein [Aporhodopirellula aestuarii]